MADIDIRRRRPVIWPWIAVVVALLLVVGGWAVWNEPDDEQIAGSVPYPTVRPGVPESAVGTAGTAPVAIREYVEFTRAEGEDADVGTVNGEREYAADGIRLLGDALAALVEQEPSEGARAQLAAYRAQVERFQPGASAMQAGAVRGIFMSAVEVMASVEGVPATEDLMSAARAIEPDRGLPEQRERVHTFFSKSAEIIQTAATS